MKEALKKFFTNDKAFIACVVVGTAGFTLYSFIQMFYYPEYYTSSINRILRAACLLVMYISYRKHEKNVMKGLIGALLGSQVIMSIPETLSLHSFRTVFKLIFLGLSFALFINHFLINRNRKARPVQIFLNQLFALLLALDTTVWTIYGLYDSIDAIDVASEFISLIGNIGFYFSIICVESRLDLYRQNREEAGWTEEEGYPKGYVHEFEKNKE